MKNCIINHSIITIKSFSINVISGDLYVELITTQLKYMNIFNYYKFYTQLTYCISTFNTIIVVVVVAAIKVVIREANSGDGSREGFLSSYGDGGSRSHSGSSSSNNRSSSRDINIVFLPKSGFSNLQDLSTNFMSK